MLYFKDAPLRETKKQKAVGIPKEEASAYGSKKAMQIRCA